MLFKVFCKSSKPVCFLLGKERKPFYFESCCLGKCETHTCLGVMGERKQHLLSCFGKVRNSYLFKRFLGKCEAYLFESFFGKVRNQTFVASFLGERAKPTFVWTFLGKCETNILLNVFWESAKPMFSIVVWESAKPIFLAKSSGKVQNQYCLRIF